MSAGPDGTTDTHTHIHTHRQTDWQADRQTGRQRQNVATTASLYSLYWRRTPRLQVSLELKTQTETDEHDHRERYKQTYNDVQSRVNIHVACARLSVRRTNTACLHANPILNSRDRPVYGDYTKRFVDLLDRDEVLCTNLLALKDLPYHIKRDVGRKWMRLRQPVPHITVTSWSINQSINRICIAPYVANESEAHNGRE